MISVQEATSIILSHLYPAKSEVVPLGKAIGRVLAEPIVADRDFPPFNRVSMDGIAISSSEFKKGRIAFSIEATQAAGTPQLKLKSTENCIEVMTGAMLPDGTDTVIRYEDVDINNGIANILISGIAS